MMRITSQDGGLILGLVLLLSIQTGTTIGADNYEPQFPYLFNPVSTGQRQVKIVSESMEDKTGYKLQEEYLDLSTGRGAVVSAGKMGNQVMFQNAATGKCYSYKPYSCEVKNITDIPSEFSEASGNVHEWNYRKRLSPSAPGGDFLVPIEGDEDVSTRQGQDEHQSPAAWEFRVFGVAGLWLFAEQRAKSFAREKKLVYSVSKDLYQESIVWTVLDPASQLLIKFHFIEGPATAYQAATLSLQMIQLVSNVKGTTNRVLRTINVLSVDYRIDEDTYDDYLEVPVGYGCFVAKEEPLGGGDQVDMIRPNENYWSEIFTSGTTGVIDLEVTATKFNSDSDSGAANASTSSRTSDTMSVQVAHSLMDQYKRLDMVRIRSTEQDVKFVSSYKYKAKYMMDLRRGTCELSHARFGPDKQTWHDELLRFNNGLELDVVRNHFELFDYATRPFHFIKQTGARDGRLEQHFYENTVQVSELRELNVLGPKSDKKARVIRSYTRNDANSQYLSLSSVSIWVLNDSEDRLEETYQINVIETEFVSGWPNEPKLFDVSEECYLNNQDLMKSGRDFAWIELTYPAAPRVLGLVAGHQLELKRQFYVNYLKQDKLDFTRVPQLELLFDNEDSFVIRMLLLNTPPLQFVYDKHTGQVISLDSQAGDTSHLAPDVEHCAELCRLSYCTIMSYCHGAMTCLLTSRSFGRELDWMDNQTSTISTTTTTKVLTEMPSCDSYTLPFLGRGKDQFDLAYFHSDSLTGILARLQHQDYGITGLPSMPDEVALPRSETQLSNEEHEKAMADYLASVYEHLNKRSTRLPQLTIAANLEGHFFVLLPNKFELENDPLRDFDLLDDADGTSMSDWMGSTTDDGHSGRPPAFHQGLAMFRYKMNIGPPQVDVSRMSGLTYDQCALACLDGRCGSFSYCKSRQECILTSVNTTGRAQALDLVERDPECFVAQRDFLANFVRFPNAYRPQLYESVADSVDVSDCALQCVSNTDFRCLAFDYCRQPAAALGRCYYHKSRSAGSQNIQPINRPPPTAKVVDAAAGNNTQQRQGQTPTGCDHYARSYLADYNRIEYRGFAEDRLAQMKTNQIEGQTVFRCAEMCSNELIDCTAFQFCYQPDRPGAKQQCTMIESKPRGDDPKNDKDEDFNAIIDENNEGRLVRAGKYLQHSTNCHLFAMRRDSSEAHLRDLALGATMTVAEQEAEAAKQRAAKGGSLWGRLFWLYIAVALVSVVVGLTVSFVRENKEALGERLRHTSSHWRVRLGI